ALPAVERPGAALRAPAARHRRIAVPHPSHARALRAHPRRAPQSGGRRARRGGARRPQGEDRAGAAARGGGEGARAARLSQDHRQAAAGPVIALGREEVASLLDPSALVDAVATALADLSAGSASVPPRIAAFTPLGLLGAMVGYVPSLDVLAAKLVAVFPQNTAMPTHQALVAVFDPRSGAPVAILDGEEITAQRTAAASALATRLLAREDAEVLAIVGTGVQAASHARYLASTRKFRAVGVP